MPSTAGGYAANAVRFALAAVGAILAVGAVVALLRVPPPPPGSDGFPAGMAFLFGGLVFILGLGTTALGLALPSVLGTDDVLGFGRTQRLLLQAAGFCLVGGLFGGVGGAFALGFGIGVLVFLAGVLLSVVPVSIALAWRLGEVVYSALGRVRAGVA